MTDVKEAPSTAADGGGDIVKSPLDTSDLKSLAASAQSGKSWADLADEEEEAQNSAAAAAAAVASDDGSGTAAPVPSEPTEDLEAPPTADEVANNLGDMSTKCVAQDEDEPAKTTLDEPAFEDDATTNIVVEQNDPNSPLYSAHTFEELGLSPELLQGVYAMKYNKPSKIQEASLPVILSNPVRHLIAQAQSGTGKTASFTLGLLSRVNVNKKVPQALCVVHTRELARQVQSVVEDIGKFTGISVLLAVPESAQLASRSKISHQVVIGTPGKIQDLIQRRLLICKEINIFVLDEADHMIDAQGMGDRTIRIKKLMPRHCQYLLFSATYKPEVEKFAEKFVPQPFVKITLQKKKLSLDSIHQLFIDCGSQRDKFDVLCELYACLTIGQSIIFVHTRNTAKQLYNDMTKEGHTVSLIHGGDMPPTERDRVIDDFRDGKTKVLISTNVLARGIDVLQVSLVINYDLPMDRMNRPDNETYLHRIGRTGRFGKKGIAINFVHDSESMRKLREIEAHWGRPIHPLDKNDVEKLGQMLREL